MEEKMEKTKIVILDNKLRDGEQSPGASLNMHAKVNIANQLSRLGVDVMEAGFPISSPGDFESVKLIAKEVRGSVIAGLARATKKDIDACWGAVKYASRPRIHTFIATSDIHMKYKLKMTREEVLRNAVAAVRHARRFTDDVEFSAEDAVRSDFTFLVKVVESAIRAGARTINIPDTVGYSIPQEFGNMVKRIIETVPDSDKAIFSVHCHNDLGMATANSLAAVLCGARQVECTVNGLGERAGNAALEEVVMGIRTRKDLFDFYTGIRTTEIYKTSRLVAKLTGIEVQRNKAIVGANAFAHEAGIHQDGVIKKSLTYEIMTPQSIGLSESELVMGKHSGRHALRKKLSDMGYKLSDKKIDEVFSRFKELADKKKTVFDQDIEAIVEDEAYAEEEVFKLNYMNVTSGTDTVPTATVRIAVRSDGKEKTVQEAACGDGPVDAAFKAIDRITGIRCKLVDYNLRAVSVGKDAMGEVTLKVVPLGRAKGEEPVTTGRGTSTDIIEASARAYVNAMNRLARKK